MRDVDGVRMVGHGGTTNGHHSDFHMVPERNFAVISMTNCGPNGPQLNDEVSKWALESYLGVIDKDPEPILLSDEQLAPYLGDYETIAATVHIVADKGRLLFDVKIKPEMAKVLQEQGEEIPEQPPVPVALLPGDGDRNIVVDGPAKGMKGYFRRNGAGEVDGAHFGGRLATRVK
jgi:hypothetical protein